MIIEENKQIETPVTVDVICDCCGESCKVSDIPLLFEYMTLSSNWGFYSNHDCESWNAEICEKCVEEKLTFVKFKKHDYFTDRKIQ